MDISASETCVPIYCQPLSVSRAEIRLKLTGAKVKECNAERQICGDMNGLQVFFSPLFFFQGDRNGESVRCRAVTPRCLPSTLSLCFMADKLFLKPEWGAVRTGPERNGDGFTARALSVYRSAHSKHTQKGCVTERGKRSAYQVVLQIKQTPGSAGRVKVRESLPR